MKYTDIRPLNPQISIITVERKEGCCEIKRLRLYFAFITSVNKTVLVHMKEWHTSIFHGTSWLGVYEKNFENRHGWALTIKYPPSIVDYKSVDYKSVDCGL